MEENEIHNVSERQSPSPNGWRGHDPRTRRVLQAILVRAAGSDEPISFRDRILVNACELRAQLANGELLAYLATDTHRRLCEARIALKEIGATTLAASITLAMTEARRFQGEPRAWGSVVKLEAALALEGEALDAMIASYSTALDGGDCR